MAVISELIDSGLRLKQQRKLRGAIEHFRQLHRTYPENARIQFELANCWLAFGVPENALPHYRELLEPPKAKGLPPKDLPRLYTQLCATLHQLDENQAALEYAQAGLSLHPNYRPLRAWQIFALAATGAHQVAVLDALELLLEALAPSRWDVFEDDIKQELREMRARLEHQEPAQLASEASQAPASPSSAADPPASTEAGKQRIDIHAGEAAADDTAEHEIAVTMRPPTKKKTRRRRLPQLGKRSVRINISAGDDKPPADDRPAAAAFKIPVDD